MSDKARKAGRLLVWLAMAACLYADSPVVSCLFGYGCSIDYDLRIVAALLAAAQVALIWAELRLRPPPRVDKLFIP